MARGVVEGPADLCRGENAEDEARIGFDLDGGKQELLARWMRREAGDQFGRHHRLPRRAERPGSGFDLIQVIDGNPPFGERTALGNERRDRRIEEGCGTGWGSGR